MSSRSSDSVLSEDIDNIDIRVDNTIARCIRRAFRVVRPSMRVDRFGAPLGRRGTPPPVQMQERAAAPNEARMAEANSELQQLIYEEWDADPVQLAMARRARREAAAAASSSRLAPTTTTTTTPSSSHLNRRVIEPVLPMRPTSPPVPTTEGTRRFQRIPVREGENDELIRLVPLIGRIEDLVEYPSSPDPSSRTSPAPRRRPAEPWLTDIMDRRRRRRNMLLASTSASASTSSSQPSNGSRIIPVVVDEEDQPTRRTTEQSRPSPMTGAQAARLRAAMDQVRSLCA